MKKRPTWATVVGIFGIVISSFGILGAAQTMVMPKMMEFQKQMFSDISRQIERDAANQTSSDEEQSRQEAKAMFETMEKIWSFPQWYNTWSIVTGLLQLAIYGFYLFACIWLLQMKPSSIKMFYFAAGAKIAHGVLNCILGVMSSSFMVMAMMAWGAVGIVIHIVLLIVVATADKKEFLPETQQSVS
ncbi:MAG: hypothetical protein PHQ96_08315 [Candidatus Omnitrophica bacterium]|nr:hypothetical protein [Candidatus Omnitrophota bacterium]